MSGGGLLAGVELGDGKVAVGVVAVATSELEVSLPRLRCPSGRARVVPARAATRRVSRPRIFAGQGSLRRARGRIFFEDV